MHTFHLHAVADVYARRTDGDTLVTINAIPVTSGNPLHERFVPLQLAALLAAFVVVGHHHRVFVEHRGLQPAVRTDVRTRLLAKAREDGEEQQREQHHERQAGDVMARIIGDDRDERVAADDVGEQRVADNEGQHEEDAELEGFLRELPGRPWRGGEQALLHGVALDQILQFAENHFHHHRLRTRPTAPESPERRREDDDAGDEDEHRHGEDDHVLRPEELAEDGEPSLNDIHHEQRVAVDLDERSGKHDADEQPAHPGAPLRPFAMRLFGIDPLAPTEFVGRRQVIAKVLPVRLLRSLKGIMVGGFVVGRFRGHSKLVVTPALTPGEGGIIRRCLVKSVVNSVMFITSRICGNRRQH